jgi:transcriptional regulator of met regulon
MSMTLELNINTRRHRQTGHGLPTNTAVQKEKRREISPAQVIIMFLEEALEPTPKKSRSRRSTSPRAVQRRR